MRDVYMSPPVGLVAIYSSWFFALQERGLSKDKQGRAHLTAGWFSLKKNYRYARNILGVVPWRACRTLGFVLSYEHSIVPHIYQKWRWVGDLRILFSVSGNVKIFHNFPQCLILTAGQSDSVVLSLNSAWVWASQCLGLWMELWIVLSNSWSHGSIVEIILGKEVALLCCIISLKRNHAYGVYSGGRFRSCHGQALRRYAFFFSPRNQTGC